eukprot:2977989-Rhodomonas_salina.3
MSGAQIAKSNTRNHNLRSVDSRPETLLGLVDHDAECLLRDRPRAFRGVDFGVEFAAVAHDAS